MPFLSTLSPLLMGRITRGPTASPDERIQRARAATYPLRHPRAWYHLVDSAELAPGSSVEVDALGRRFTVERDPTGALAARWDDAGRSVEVPVYEQAGLVIAWFDDAGGPPEYRPELVPELADGRMVPRGSYRPRPIHMHLWEFAENSVDMAHFAQVHEALTLPWTQLEIPGMGLHHAARWCPDDGPPWQIRFADVATLTRGGVPLPETTSEAEALLVGPASLVVFRLEVPQVGRVCIVQTHTPLQREGDPLALRVRFAWFAEPHVWRLLAFYVVGNWVSQWWRDVDLWENKVHLPKPVLCPGDGPVHTFRRWYRQFYPTFQRNEHAHAV